MKKLFAVVGVLVMASALFVGCSDQVDSPTASAKGGEPVAALDAARVDQLLGVKEIPEGITVPDGYLDYRQELASRIVSGQLPQAVAGKALAAAPACWVSDFGTGLNQRDDDCDFISFGFNFDFYGNTYSGIWVNSNGNMTFNGCNSGWSHPNVPDGGNVLVAPLYGDFNPSGGGDVYANVIGTAPNRQAVFTWYVVPEFSDGSNGPNTFQAVLSEGSNDILFGYNGLTTDGINWSGDLSMDVGISSGTGQYINYASGSAIPALDGTNVLFQWTGTDYTASGDCASNSPPTADAGPDQTVECAGASTDVVLDGSGSSDPDGDDLDYSWSEGTTATATGVNPTVGLSHGTHTITLTVDDGNGETDTDDVVVEIVDTTDPEISQTPGPTSLWPPNHEMVLVLSGVSASDICDSAPSVTIEVTSDEDINGTGDGDTEPDWEVVDNGDGTQDVYVRAERSGNGDGRVYTIEVTATDASSNSSGTSTDVTVAHDKGKGKKK